MAHFSSNRTAIGWNYFFEGLVTHDPRTGKSNQRERQPFAQNRDVSGAEDGQSIRHHLFNVFSD